MNDKLTKFFVSTRVFMDKHSPEILTAMGIIGYITTTVSAVKATPKAVELINQKKEETGLNKLTIIDTIKVSWKQYLPSVIIGATSTACIIGASATNYKRNAALASAYALSESTLIRYKDKVIETIGERKEREIQEKVSQDEVNKNKLDNKAIIVTSNGNTLCMDSFSGRYFKSDLESIKKAVNIVNRKLIYQNYISLNEFYDEIGLDGIKNGEILGWNLDQGLMEPTFSTCLADNGQPCIVIDFTVAPRYDFDKLM